MPSALDISANLAVSIDSDTMTVHAEQSCIQIDVPSLGSVLTHVKPWLSRSKRHVILRRIDAALTAASLEVHIRLAGRTIARLGTAARPGLISRLLGFGPVELRPFTIGVAWWQSGPR
jgi:hypothetical protein